MKKFLITLLTTCIIAGAKGQFIDLIPRVGINLATQNIQGPAGNKMKTGIQGGLGLNIKTGPGNFSVQPEINYMVRGTRINGTNLKDNLNLSYLEIPLLAKYSSNFFYVDAGPSISMLLSRERKVIHQYGYKLKKVDFGIGMGAGMALPLGKGKFIVDGRYYHGLVDVGTATAIKNRGVSVSLGYAVTLGSMF